MSSTEYDSLDLLRGAIASSRPLVLLTSANEPTSSLSQAAYISFPDPSGDGDGGGAPINLTKETPTRFTSSAEGTHDRYTLGQLWLAWTERETGVREYLEKGREAGGYVGIADRRVVQEFLAGTRDGEGRVVPKVRADGTDGSTAPLGMAGEKIGGETAEAGPSKSAPLKRKYEVDVADREFCRQLRLQEVELVDRNTVLRVSRGGKINGDITHDAPAIERLLMKQNFTPFLQTVMAEKIRALRNSMSAGSGKAQPAQQPAYDPSRGAKKAKSTNPIIVISSSPTALITMWNVKKFLEQGIFEPSEVAKQHEAAQGNPRAEDMIPILRKRTGPNGEVTSKYYVVDGVEALQKFGTDAWDRVICVLTTGQAWQFKAYKWQDPKVLFRHVKGIYFQWSNEASNPAVKDWNISAMRIDRNKRHTDRQVVADFWRTLDNVKKR